MLIPHDLGYEVIYGKNLVKETNTCKVNYVEFKIERRPNECFM
jgi:hypothetical protein